MTYLIFSFTGSLISISFGMMLGWPSPSYPELLSSNATIPITLDESAMIAGMLMNGYVISTLFSKIPYISSKNGAIFGSTLIIIGWIILHFSTNVLMLCFSRLFIGLGTGFGFGKFIDYVTALFDKQLRGIILRNSTLLTVFGIMVMYVIGNLMSMQLLALISVILPTVSFIILTFLPDSPKDLYRWGKFEEAESVIRISFGKNYVQEGLEVIKMSLETKQLGVIDVIKDRNVRNKLLLLTFLMTIQQFTGGPSLIVYSQVVFKELNYIRPEIYSIIYILIYFIATYVGVFHVPKLKRKPTLLISLLGATLSTTIHTFFLYFNVYEEVFELFPLVVLLVYSFFHTFGLTFVPGLLIGDVFDENCSCVVKCFSIMYSSQLAVIITKIFQVMYGKYGMYAPFALYSSVGAFGAVLVTICFKETRR